MVSTRRKSANGQPVRQSRRPRILNTRLGTPPKIVQDMLKDHSSLPTTRRHAVTEDVEKLGTSTTNSSTRKIVAPEVKPTNNVTKKLEARPRRQHIPNRRYASPFGEPTKSQCSLKNHSNKKAKAKARVISVTAKDALSPTTNKRRIQCSSKESVDNAAVKIRHSSHHHISNPHFDYFVPGFLQSKKERLGTDMRRSNESKTTNYARRETGMTLSVLKQEKVVAHNRKTSSRISCEVLGEQRHSLRQRIPSKRLNFPDLQPKIQAHKKSNDAGSQQKSKKAPINFRKHVNSEKISRTVSMTSLNVTSSSRDLLLTPSTNSSRQIHSSSEVPSILYPYKPARSQALCVHPSSSSLAKDYTSKKDVDDLLEEINGALAHASDGENYSELRQKIAHHLKSLHRENCRFRQTLRQLRAELESLSNSSTVDRCNLLLKQNGDLREQKVLADVKYELQSEEVRKLTEMIAVLEMRNKNLEKQLQFMEQNRRKQEVQQQPLNCELEQLRGAEKNDSCKETELGDSDMAVGINSAYVNGHASDAVKEGLRTEVAWGNDSCMLNCD